MGDKKRQFSPEFKQSAVRMVVAGTKTRAQVARELGIRADLLFRWQARLAPKSMADPAPDRQSDCDRVRQLERELERVKEERDILKKATAFFAKEQL